VALADPLNPSTVDELAYVTGGDPVGGGGSGHDREGHRQTLRDEAESVGDLLKELGADADIAKEVAEAAAGDGVMDLEDLANEAPIIKFVNLVLYPGGQDRASDIHFEPFEDEFKIRYRVDGALYEMTPPPEAPGAAGDLAHQGHGQPGHCRAAVAAGRPHLA
jgi:type IV pilus assembly protein PilB